MTIANETGTPLNDTVIQVDEIIKNSQLVTGNDTGKAINLKNGENFTLMLSTNPSCGYFWDVNVSKGLKILIGFDNGYPNNEPEGSPENYTWVIQSTSPGSQQVNGVCKGPNGICYGSDGKPVENFTLNVEVV